MFIRYGKKLLFVSCLLSVEIGLILVSILTIILVPLLTW